MIKLIIFDLWHTLAYRKGDHKDASIKKILNKANTSIPFQKAVKIFENSIQKKKWGSKFEAYKNFCKNLGLETTKDNINLLIEIRDKEEKKTKLYAHTIQMLKKLRKNGYKIGLISNSSIFAISQIKKKTQLLNFIDYPLFSFDVGVIKPDVRFFQKMLKLTDYQPNEAVMIGDRLNDDVLPPRKLGMHSILYKNYQDLKKNLNSLGIILD